jgi:AcrR family transcriptional regulator
MQTARPARRSTELTRQRLIDGAVDILRREGLAAATTGRIASAAGLKQPTFYVHFEDRDEVFEAAASEIGRRMLEKLQRQHTKFDPKDVRRSLTESYRSMLNGFLSEPELTRIFLRYRGDEGTVFGRVFGRQIDEARRAIVRSVHIYGVTSERSAAREVVEAYVEMIVSSVLGMLEALIDGRVRDREVAVEALADLTTMALRNPSPREAKSSSVGAPTPTRR